MRASSMDTDFVAYRVLVKPGQTPRQALREAFGRDGVSLPRAWWGLGCDVFYLQRMDEVPDRGLHFEIRGIPIPDQWVIRFENIYA